MLEPLSVLGKAAIGLRKSVWRAVLGYKKRVFSFSTTAVACIPLYCMCLWPMQVSSIPTHVYAWVCTCMHACILHAGECARAGVCCMRAGLQACVR